MNYLWKSSSNKPQSAPCPPEGRRIYAIGDIHGSATLLTRLIDRIRADAAARDARHETLIILGDFIDRGADSAAVMNGLFANRSSENLVVLLGNHESAMVSAYRGDRSALAFWLKFGGVETLASFGVDMAGMGAADIEAAMIRLRRSVPEHLIEWMETLPTSYRAGDYLFVHAGIRPRIRLARQKPADFLWIRDEFLASEDDHGVVVVHGHSQVERVQFKPNRISLDTGAYQSGVLSAVGLQDSERWVIDTA